MAQRIDAYTGGVGFSTHARTRFDDAGDCVPFISFNGKCLLRNQEPMFDIIRELLHHADFSNLARLKSILLEYRAGLESMVIHSGHRLAISLAARNLSATRMLSETWGGVHQLQTIKRLSDDITEPDLIALSGDLTAIGKALFTQKNFQMALIGEAAALTGARSCTQSVLDGFTAGKDNGFKAPDMAMKRQNYQRRLEHIVGRILRGPCIMKQFAWPMRMLRPWPSSVKFCGPCTCIAKFVKKAVPMAGLHYTAPKMVCSVSLPIGIPTSYPH